MIVEALKFLSQQAADAILPKQTDNGRNSVRWIKPSGEIIELPDAIPPREHRVFSFESFHTAIAEAGNDASIWHYGDFVRCILNDKNDSYRDDQVVWPLNRSRKYVALTEQACTPRKHVDFVRWLVQNLRDELEGSAPGLLGKLRAMDFRSSSSERADIQQGRESMGREINRQIANAADLPETVIIRLRRWADLDHIAEVECMLAIDLDDARLALVPLADELYEAENKAQGYLHNLVADNQKAPVFYGAP